MRIRFTGIIIFLMVAMSVQFAMAAIGENVTVSLGGTGNYSTSISLPGNVTAQGGNVTRVDTQRNTSTVKWQGFYGNTTGNLKLGLNQDTLYDFGSTTIAADAVYAAQDPDFDFANLDNTTAAQVDTAFGFGVPADIDQTVDIYTGNIAAIDGLVNVPAATLQDTNFQCYLVDDTNTAVVNDFAFGGEVQAAGAVGFDGATWQYELMVPINAGTPTYYFFLSI